MDDFHVLDDVSSADGPANLKRIEANKKERKKTITSVQYQINIYIYDSLCVTFQPVALKVFPALPTVMVRSHMPGRLAVNDKTSFVLKSLLVWESIFFWTPSVSHRSLHVWCHHRWATHRPHRWSTADRVWCTDQQSFGVPQSYKPENNIDDATVLCLSFVFFKQKWSQWLNNVTLPSGLLGVLITIAFVRGVILLVSSSAERTQSPLDSTVLPSLCHKNKVFLD